ISKQQAFEVIKTARNIAHKIDLNLLDNISEKTKEDYTHCFERFLYKSTSKEINTRAKEILLLATDTKYKNTWFKRRASLVYYCRKRLLEFLKEQDKLQKAINDKLIDGKDKIKLENDWLKLVLKSQLFIKILIIIPIECPIAENELKKRTSKRQDMKNLAEDWRDQVIDEAIDKWLLPILALSVTGCRNEELLKGVKFEVKNNKLSCKINSAKVKDGQITIKSKNDSGQEIKSIVKYHAGQEVREMIFDLGKYKMVDMLAKAVGSSLKITINNKSSLTSVVRAISKKLWPERQKSITSYCFRHALGSDMKASKMSDDKISIALGHAVSATKS
ncbi:MAG: hypothetical protein Q7U42_02860, partial [Parvibaculum sp.]|nr:hypothetical protein [Parvibaculum sp.]